ncbi:hypothetical protein Q8A73_001020 [Channa argus]|nr:hypothetical protein Q8A73_001020 [Channa argus]
MEGRPKFWLTAARSLRRRSKVPEYDRGVFFWFDPVTSVSSDSRPHTDGQSKPKMSGQHRCWRWLGEQGTAQPPTHPHSESHSNTITMEGIRRGSSSCVLPPHCSPRFPSARLICLCQSEPNWCFVLPDTKHQSFRHNVRPLLPEGIWDPPGYSIWTLRANEPEGERDVPVLHETRPPLCSLFTRLPRFFGELVLIILAVNDLWCAASMAQVSSPRITWPGTYFCSYAPSPGVDCS